MNFPSPKPCKKCEENKCWASSYVCEHVCHQAKPEGKCKDCQFEGNDHSFECPQYIETIPPEVSPEKNECSPKDGNCHYCGDTGGGSFVPCECKVCHTPKPEVVYGKDETDELTVEVFGRRLKDGTVIIDKEKYTPSPKPCCEKCLKNHPLAIGNLCSKLCHQAKPAVMGNCKECGTYYDTRTGFFRNGGMVCSKCMDKSPEVSPEKKECEHIIGFAGKIIACRKCGKRYEEIAPKKEKVCGACIMRGRCVKHMSTPAESWEDSIRYRFGWLSDVQWEIAAKEIKELLKQETASLKQKIKEEIEKMYLAAENKRENKALLTLLSLIDTL